MKTLLFLFCSALAINAAPFPPMPAGITARFMANSTPVPTKAKVVKPDGKPVSRLVSSTLPPVPMTPYFRVANSEFGTYEVAASALQPAGYGILIECSSSVTGPYSPLGYFGPAAKDQYVYAGKYTYDERQFVRATIVTEATGTKNSLAIVGMNSPAGNGAFSVAAVGPAAANSAWVGFELPPRWKRK